MNTKKSKGIIHYFLMNDTGWLLNVFGLVYLAIHMSKEETEDVE